MTKDPSLARRVVFYLVVAQLIAFLIGALVTMALDIAEVAYFGLTPNTLAANRVSALVIASLVPGEDHGPRIEPCPELRAEVQRTPDLQFAAFDEARSPIAGSSPDLVSALTKAGVIQMSSAHLHFNLPGDPETAPVGHMERKRTPFGRLHIAVYRQKFRWDDILSGFLAEEFKWNIGYLVTIVLASTGTAWFAVRRGLTPLRAAARQAEEIDFDSLSRGIVARDVPDEVRPFVDAINAALARLDASAKRMRRYTANAAHELRTPLAILRARLEAPEESTFRSDLQRDASQLQAIVEQMLIAARLTEGQASLDQEIDLVSAIRQVVTDYMPLVIECERKIEFEATETLVVTRGNQRAIKCIVANLIDNALRAEPAEGTVLVRVEDNAVVAVIDHGEGVPESDRSLIFEPFWRKNESSPGTGLGLAIAKELMDLHGGRVWVEMTPGGGATFKLLFPKLGSN